ncbi:MAG: hypothetical protein K2G16_00730 [Lachnospiraceae bacterium]|nr:hypothetical protein [Lachnospiraceae bacterium]
MKASEYNRYLEAIKVANDAKDKTVLGQIQARLLADYGMKDPDVERLIKKFRYNV